MGWSEEWKLVVTMVTINFVLGTANALIKKILDGGLDHMIIATYRLAFSTIFLAPFAYFFEKKIRPKLTARILCELFFTALIGASLAQYFLLLGLAYTSATMACAFLSMVPAITFIMAIVCRMQALKINNIAGKAKVVGTLICIAGGLVLTFYRGVPLTDIHSHAQQHHATSMQHSTKKAEKRAIGAVMLFIGCTLSSSWFLLLARIDKNYPCQYSSTVILSFFGALQSALLSLIKERRFDTWILKDKLDIATVIYAGVVGQGIGTVGMMWCIKQKGPVFTSAFTPLMLIFAAILDYFILHEQIYLGSVLGSILAIVGLYIFLWGRSNDSEESVTKQVHIPSQEVNDEAHYNANAICTMTALYGKC